MKHIVECYSLLSWAYGFGQVAAIYRWRSYLQAPYPLYGAYRFIRYDRKFSRPSPPSSHLRIEIETGSFH